MAAGDVKLIGMWSSPFVLRARIALNLKSIEYQWFEEEFLNKSELLLKSNPVHKKVPVLLHNGNPICESLIIIHYIDKVWTSAPPLLPTDPYDRATACFWAAYIDDKWFPAVRAISIVGGEGKQAAIDQVKEGLALLEDAFMKCSKGGDFFGGEEMGILDISLGCFLQWTKVIERLNRLPPFINEADTPHLFKWALKFSSHACVKGVTPEVDKLAKFGKFLFANLRALPKPKY